MDQKQFEEMCYQLGECVKHADAATADKRTQLIETEYQPIVLTKYHAKPSLCLDCGKQQPDRISQTHAFKGIGWKSWCNMCKLSRQPGTDYFGLKPKIEPAPEPILLSPPKPQLEPIEISPTSDSVVEFVEQVIVRDYHESVIREFVRIPIDPQPEPNDVPGPDNAIHTD